MEISLENLHVDGLGLEGLTILVSIHLRVFYSFIINEANHRSLLVVSFWGVAVEDSQIEV